MSLFETVSGLAVRHLSGERLKRARNLYLTGRRKAEPMLRWIHGTFDSEALRTHLEDRLGTEFEILMVHSSVNNMQPMFTDSPINLVRMLMDYCGPERTLVMPAFYFGDPAIGGPPATFRQRPRFDLRRTPSQMGLATELFRRSKGVLQSRHPVYRVAALGPLAAAVTQGHESAGSPAGPGTPFDVMAAHDTLILGLGKPFEVLTQVHHAEYVLGDAFPVPQRPPGEPVTMTLIDGEEEIPFALKARAFEGRLNMWKLRDIMDSKSLREWRFHHAPMFATRASEVTHALLDAAKRGVTLYDKP